MSIALIQYVEEKVTPFSIVYRLSSYVRCTNKSMIISSSSGICSTVYAGIQLIFTHIWNVIAVVLHIVGFPTDRCCAAVRSCFSPIYSFITSCCSSREQSLQAMPISTFSFANRDSGSVIASEGRTRLGGTGTKSNLAGTESSAIGSERYAAINQEVWWKLTSPYLIRVDFLFNLTV